jgi:hypothetical protein
MRQSLMNDTPTTNRLSFRVHFVRLNGPESHPTVRVLLVETTEAHTIYEGSGTWRWLIQISEFAIFGDQLAAIEKRLELKRLATIEQISASICDLESIGFLRADC